MSELSKKDSKDHSETPVESKLPQVKLPEAKKEEKPVSDKPKEAKKIDAKEAFFALSKDGQKEVLKNLGVGFGKQDYSLMHREGIELLLSQNGGKGYSSLESAINLKRGSRILPNHPSG